MRNSQALLFETPTPATTQEVNPQTAQLASAQGFLLVEYVHTQLGPEAFARLLLKLSQHGEAKRALLELSGLPWAKWKQQFRNAVLSRRFPSAPAHPAAQETQALQLKRLQALRLAKLYAHNRHHEAAAFHYAEAWGAGAHPDVAHGYVHTLLALSRFAEAERVLTTLLAQHDAPASAWVALGKLRLHNAEWSKAQKAFEQALALNPFLPELHLGLFAAAQAQGNAPLAARAQEAAAILLQTSPQTVAEMARALRGPKNP